MSDLGDLSIEAWYPKRKVLRKHRKKKREEKCYPIIPGYIFVHFSPLVVGVRKICGLKNVYGFLGIGEPLPLRDCEVSELRKREDDGEWVEQKVHAMIEERAYKVGDFVTVASGPFAGFTTQITGIEGKAVYGTIHSYRIKLIDE